MPEDRNNNEGMIQFESTAVTESGCMLPSAQETIYFQEDLQKQLTDLKKDMSMVKIAQPSHAKNKEVQ